MQREKDKGRFLPNKQLIEFNSFDSEQDLSSSQQLIQETLNKAKSDSNPKDVTQGLSKSVLAISAILIIGAIGYKIYQKRSK